MNDIDIILSHRHDLGADYWTTPDKRLNKGSPFSIIDSAHMLLELGMEPGHPILLAVAELVFSVWRPDGRFKLSPSGGILPCHTAYAVNLLCRMGYVKDERIQATLRHFLDTPYDDGGWRCNKFSYGRGPETEFSNPLPTLLVLDAFRFSGYLNNEPALDKAVEFLLMHWTVRTPIGPCQYGMGTRFMQVEYPLWHYNLFQYVFVLAHSSSCRGEPCVRPHNNTVDTIVHTLHKVRGGKLGRAQGPPLQRPLDDHFTLSWH